MFPGTKPVFLGTITPFLGTQKRSQELPITCSNSYIQLLLQIDSVTAPGYPAGYHTSWFYILESSDKSNPY